MKKLFIALVVTLAFAGASVAQKYAYVDSDYILDNIPEYKAAQNQLDELSQEYQQEIEAKFAEIDKMYKAFQAEVVLMPDDVKKKRRGR